MGNNDPIVVGPDGWLTLNENYQEQQPVGVAPATSIDMLLAHFDETAADERLSAEMRQNAITMKEMLLTLMELKPLLVEASKQDALDVAIGAVGTMAENAKHIADIEAKLAKLEQLSGDTDPTP